ncbi:MAG: hypothetical protein U1E66_14770 [Rhodospirillales bacterium]
MFVRRWGMSIADWSAAALALLAMVGAPSVRAADVADTAAMADGAELEWRPMDRSILDLLAAGYDLVSVIAPSPQTRLYFLRASGTIVKCTEQAVPSAPPPMPPPPPGVANAPAAPPPQPQPTVRKGSGKPASNFECNELVRNSSRRR